MNTMKKRRLAKYKRTRKEVRISNYTQHWLNTLSAYYQSTETAIIEAAVQAFGARYTIDAISEIGNKQAGKNRPYVEQAKKFEKIGENIDQGILHV
ncbi:MULTISPECIES: hypothetical protein [unclassified Marinobacter]|uniref:hypothetical protein n=1 Tax=unclassified Marinobacter TaxID=83889 RepID=UPI0026E01D67|nr:hypothetical protein [Marinobacter sp. SS5-14b]